MSLFKQRRAGLLFGSFTTDALSLGVHWIYDTEELSLKAKETLENIFGSLT